jgi:signal transduction histidine kinase
MEGPHTRNIEVIFAVAIVTVILGASSVCLAATTDINESDPYVLEPEAREVLIAFVNEARNFVVEQGKEKALEVFNDPKGEFVRGELYIIAYDFNGTRLAHPYQPEGIGKNALNVTDLNGLPLPGICETWQNGEADSHTTSGLILLTLMPRSLS